MEINDMQKIVDDYIGQFEIGYFSPLASLARLTEEVGELAREINHHYGEKPKKESESEKAISEELGDVLFVVITLANSLEVDLGDAFSQVMEKFEKRDRYRFKRVDGQTAPDTKMSDSDE